MLILRPIDPGDLDSLVDLAQQLDSINLPAEREFLEERIDVSVRSFGKELPDWRDGVYVFVLEDTQAQRCVGTSTIIAKRGRPGDIYFWLAVTTEERRSADLGRRFVHTKLQLLSTDDGPTEIGGLILDPSYRRHAARCGKALSIVRFAYMSMHPDAFEREVIAELLSPFEETGSNLLWDAFGAKFTALPYREADRLSSRTKQFIADLFPRDPVYATLFPENVQAVIGTPGEAAKAALRILEKVGFHYLNQVDPFDGGPYYGAARNAIASVRERRQLVLPGVPAEIPAGRRGASGLLAAEGAHGFRATVVALDDEGAPHVSQACRDALGVSSGDRVSVTPLP
ncbi:MAG TPA: arginine N-succinyltransferase [Myxococcota bacterium]